MSFFYFWVHGMFSGINEEKKKSMPYASCHFFYLSLKFVFVFFHLFIFTIKEIYQKNRAKEGERERERETVSRECGTLKPKKYQRGPCSLQSETLGVDCTRPTEPKSSLQEREREREEEEEN